MTHVKLTCIIVLVYNNQRKLLSTLMYPWQHYDMLLSKVTELSNGLDWQKHFTIDAGTKRDNFEIKE